MRICGNMSGTNSDSHEKVETVWARQKKQMEEKHSRGRPRLQWKDTIRRDMKTWNIREE